MFTEEQIQKFQEIYEEEFEERISKTEAIRQAIKLVGLVKIGIKKSN